MKTSHEPWACFIYILSAEPYLLLVHVMYSINACQDEWNRTAFYHVIWVPFLVTIFPFARFNCVVRKTEFKAFRFENGSRRIFTAVDIIIRSKKNIFVTSYIFSCSLQQTIVFLFSKGKTLPNHKFLLGFTRRLFVCIPLLWDWSCLRSIFFTLYYFIKQRNSFFSCWLFFLPCG